MWAPGLFGALHPRDAPLVPSLEEPAPPSCVTMVAVMEAHHAGADGPSGPSPSGRGAQYPDDEAAIAECIGLARGMTSKHAAYGTGFSGAKLVVNCDGERPAPAARPAAEG